MDSMPFIGGLILENDAFICAVLFNNPKYEQDITFVISPNLSEIQ